MNSFEIFRVFFDSSPYLNAISFLLAIAGIFFSVFFYKKSKKEKKPIYMLRTVNLIRENIQKIDRINILYDGKTVNNLSITKIALWNGGKSTIDNKDVAKKDPLRLAIKNDCNFLDAEIIYQKNASNGFDISISDDQKYIHIAFDYFDFEEGIVLQIFHTGHKSSDISLMGQIKSVKQIQRGYNSQFIIPIFLVNMLQEAKITHGKVKLLFRWSSIIMGVLLILLSIAQFMNLEFVKYNSEVERKVTMILGGVLGLLYLFIGYKSVRRYIPKGFDIFNEEFLKEKKNKESE